ncbi:MAG: LysR family transcriptional regulator [Myxococcales bacterium]|nr:LysR family transcriptional regulator [Myxococcales bacterium]
MNANASQIDGEDVRTYLAIARAGSLNGAAHSLGMHHSTVYRRLERLEEALGTPLFEREGSRYQPTAAGEAFGVHARRVEDELFALQRAVLGNTLMPAGVLRLTTLESLLPWVLPALSTLEARCPDLTVELDAGTQTRSLDRRDADMALRPSESPPEDAVGRRSRRWRGPPTGPWGAVVASFPGCPTWAPLDGSRAPVPCKRGAQRPPQEGSDLARWRRWPQPLPRGSAGARCPAISETATPSYTASAHPRRPNAARCGYSCIPTCATARASAR